MAAAQFVVPLVQRPDSASSACITTFISARLSSGPVTAPAAGAVTLSAGARDALSGLRYPARDSWSFCSAALGSSAFAAFHPAETPARYWLSAMASATSAGTGWLFAWAAGVGAAASCSKTANVAIASIALSFFGQPSSKKYWLLMRWSAMALRYRRAFSTGSAVEPSENFIVSTGPATAPAAGAANSPESSATITAPRSTRLAARMRSSAGSPINSMACRMARTAALSVVKSVVAGAACAVGAARVALWAITISVTAPDSTFRPRYETRPRPSLFTMLQPS